MKRVTDAWTQWQFVPPTIISNQQPLILNMPCNSLKFDIRGGVESDVINEPSFRPVQSLAAVTVVC